MVKITFSSDTSRQFWVLFWGFLWTVAGGLGPAAMLLWWDLTTYQDYGVNWSLIWQTALSGAGPMAFGYWRKHKAEIAALLNIPDDVRAELEAARVITGQFKAMKEEQ